MAEQLNLDMEEIGQRLKTLSEEKKSLDSFSKIDFSSVYKGEFITHEGRTILSLWQSGRAEPIQTEFTTDGTIKKSMVHVVTEQSEANAVAQSELKDDLIALSNNL